MTDTKRCFVALPLPEIWKQVALSVMSDLGGVVSDAYRFETVDNLHVTVRFLGDVDGDMLAAVKDAVGDAAARSIPAMGALGLAGVFDRDEGSHILCQWVEDQNETMARVHRMVNRSVEKLPVSPLAFEYTPHITLGRPGRKNRESDDAAIRGRLERYNVRLGELVNGAPAWTFERLELRESVRTADGTVEFPVVHSYEFGG